MKIKELYIRKFGKLKDYKLVLLDGMNVVYGNNEAGKTTIFNFILAMLYGFSNTRGKGLADSARKKYMTWGENKIGGTMTVENNGTTYVIDRVFGKTKAGDSLEFTNLTIGEQIFLPSGREVGEYLFDLDEKSFKGTCFITQLSKDDVCENDSVKTKLSNLSSVGDAEYSFDDVFGRLKASSLEITRKTSTGKIYPLETEKIKLEEKNRQIGFDLRGINDIANENAMLENNSKELKEELSKINVLVDRANKYKTAKKYIETVKTNENIDALRTEYQKAQSRITCKDFVADRQYVDELKTILSERESAKIKCEYAEDTLENERRTYEKLASSKNETNTKTSALPFVLAFAAMILIAVLLFVILNNIVVSVATFVVSAVVIACAYFVVNSKNKKSFAVSGEDKLSSELEVLEKSVEKFENAKEEFSLADSKFKEKYLLFFEENEIDKAQDNIKTLILSLDEYVAAKSRYDVVKSSFVSQEVLEQMRLSVDENALNDEDAGNIDLSKVESRKKYIENEVLNIEKKLLVNNERAKDRAKLEEELENNVRTVDEMNEKISAYEYARDCIELAKQGLESAQAEMQKQFAPDVSRLVSEILREITCGKYEQMTLNSNLQTMIVDNESGAAREDGYMSAGTLDQVYLALRLAIIKLIFDEREYPVICMDDALLSFDLIRMEKAAQYISTILAERAQVIFFTCRDTEKACFANANLISI